MNYRQIDSIQELDELPVGAVVRDQYGDIYEKEFAGGTEGRGVVWSTPGDSLFTWAGTFGLPCQLLWEPPQ
jgi:hypothetical protein